MKQVDRLLSNRDLDVWTFFAYWTPFIVGARTEVVVALDWTSFAADGQDTIVLSMVTGHGRATPLGLRFTAAARAAGVESRVTAHSRGVGLAWELTSRGASTTDVDARWQLEHLMEGSALTSAGVIAERGAVARYL